MMFPGLNRLWQDITGVTASNTAAGYQLEGNAQARTDLQNTLGGYAQAGQGALDSQMALTGALGPEAQQAAVDAMQNSPMFQSMIQQGEKGILQNAAATGGLRGGNTQGMLAQFAPQMLSQQIQQRFQNLGGIAGQGLAASQQLGSGLADLSVGAGNINASNILGGYNLQRGLVSDIAGAGMNIAKIAGGF